MDQWQLVANEPASGPLYLANGYMGTSLDFSGGALHSSVPPACFVRGVYNDSGPGLIDRLAHVPCWSLLRYGAPTREQGYRRDLNLREGILRTTFDLEDDRGPLQLEQTMFVSRADRHLAVIRLAIRPQFAGTIEILAGLESALNEDFETLDVGSCEGVLWQHVKSRRYGIGLAEALHFHAPGWSHEDSLAQNAIHRTWRIAAQAGGEIELVQFVRLATTLETEDPLRFAKAGQFGYEEALQAHLGSWERLWQTDIEIDGDPEVQAYVHAALFYLWSTMREDDRWSIAPMGLSSNGYNGHIFWDAELWMYPTLLLTQPEMARSCVRYREATIGPAKERAASNGHRGAQFPWEAAFTGEEMTPTWAETRDFQLHITADVAIGQWWYYLNTLDLDWLRSHGYPVIKECAEYWASRVEYHRETDRYEISNVVCADEYAEHVNNDAFTNAAVHNALLIAARAAELVGEQAPPEWQEIAGKMYVAYDRDQGIHLEYDGFDGRVTKQADVELLAFPLEYVRDPEQVARDLDYYARVIDPNGPAMSFSVYSVVSAQLDRAEDAYSYFRRSYEPNTRAPFYAFSETPTNNEFLFCTGIVGSLQSLLFGFSGIRLREGYFVLQPLLPPNWTALRLQNLYLTGVRTDIEIGQGRTIVRRHSEAGDLEVTIRAAEDRREVCISPLRGRQELQIQILREDGTVLGSMPARPGTWQSVSDRAGSPRIKVGFEGVRPLLDVLLR